MPNPSDDPAVRRRRWAVSQLSRDLVPSDPIFVPAVDAALEAKASGGGGPAALRRYLRVLRERGTHPLLVSTAEVRAVIDQITATDVGYRNAARVITAMYRRAEEAGLCPGNPCADLPPIRQSRWARQMSLAELQRLLAVCRASFDHLSRGLAARRDHLLFLILLAGLVDRDAITALRWGHVEGADRALRRPDGTLTLLPGAVTTALRGYRDALLAAGVAVVPDDALICGFHPRTRRSWLEDERDLLHPVESETLFAITSRWFRRAGAFSKHGGRGASLGWLVLPSGLTVDDVEAGERRIATRRPAA